MRKLPVIIVWLFVVAGSVGQAGVHEPAFSLTKASVTRRFTASELLARQGATDLTIANDVSYGHAANYRAVPLLTLLSEMPPDAQSDTLEARATDGFVAQIPLSLMKHAATEARFRGSPSSLPTVTGQTSPGKAEGPGPEHPSVF